MGASLVEVRERVQQRLNDTDARRGSFDVVQYDCAIADSFLILSGRLPAPHLYTASAFTISAGSETFTLPTTNVPAGFVSYPQHAGDVRIQLASTGTFLDKRTREEIDAMRNGTVGASGASVPYAFALWEEKSQSDAAPVSVAGICYPPAKAAEACNLYRNLVADDLRDAVVMEGAEIQLSRYAMTALVLHVAAGLVAQMTPDDLKLRKLNPSVAGLWIKQADALLYQDEARQHSLASVGRIERWVS